MTKVNVFGSRMVLVTKPVGWSSKGMYLKRLPSSASDAQKTARANFARAAINTYGSTGKASYKGVSMPSAAVKIAATLSGTGNKQAAQQRKESNKAIRHQAAVARWGGGQVLPGAF